MADANEIEEKKGSESSEEADDQDLDLDEGDEDAGDDAGDDKGEKGKGDKKPEDPDARRARLERELKQHNKKYPPKTEKQADKGASKKGELDYGQKAFLKASGIQNDAEMTLVQEYVKDSGKSLEAVLANKAFVADLKDLRDADAASDAIPEGKRGGNAARDSVEYWVAKGELPPNTPENTELRRKVVAAKMKKASGGSPFSKNPVVGG